MNRRAIIYCKRSLALVILASYGAGCVIMPQGSTLAPPQPAKVKIAQAALVERVVVADERLSAPDVTEEALTMNFAQLLSQAGYFREVKVVPESISQGYNLRLHFDRYNVTRRIHPIYFPAAFLTMTLYIWFGGPMFRDEVDLKADLTIDDSEGATLAKKSEERRYSENVNLYSPKRATWDGAQERTTLIQSLSDGALGMLHTTGGRP